jgi:peptidyl-dipeptidase A
MKHMRALTPLALAALLALALPALAAAHDEPPTAEDARAFVEDAEAQLLRAWMDAERAAWVQLTYITQDTEAIAAQAQERAIGVATGLAQEAALYDAVAVDPDLRRRLDLLKLSLTLPAPDDAALRGELTRITTEMESTYGAGRYCRADGTCLSLQELSRILAESRDPAALQEAWVGWRTISPPMRGPFARYVELANQGARELGFADLGAMWRSKYDMPADDFAVEVDRLWGQVRPFYESLHCFVRARLAERYGEAVQPRTGPIRADLLGNMWAQEWSNVYDLVAPAGADRALDVTALLRERGIDEVEMVRIAERFFTSLGCDPLPESFWERSMFTKPRDREVVCHASAWNLDWQNDLRIKMCIEVTEEDFVTIHHELGHNFYQRAYNELPFLFQDSANDGFHEAVGDTVALSVTPEYLQRIGLVEEVPPAADDVPMLLKEAMDKIAFLPFGLLIDQWRWRVFSGEFPPERYNASWWQLRTQYQGITPPVARSEADFDPGAKYHLPANVPYTRYFLARILQFQLHRALCQAAGQEGPLHRCSIYGSEEAGRRLRELLEMGSSRPWPDALEAITGQRQMDASAIVDYFAPLSGWLAEQNRGERCGW